MRASTILALSAFSLAISSTAWAETKAHHVPATVAAKGNVTTMEVVKIKGRRQVPSAVVDVGRLVPRAPLPDLKKPLVDRIAAAIESDPF